MLNIILIINNNFSCKSKFIEVAHYITQKLPLRLLRWYFNLRLLKVNTWIFMYSVANVPKNDDFYKGMCQSVPHKDVVVEEVVCVCRKMTWSTLFLLTVLYIVNVHFPGHQTIFVTSLRSSITVSGLGTSKAPYLKT